MWTKKDVSQFVDLTSLNVFDSPESIEKFTKNALEYATKGFEVAAICVFPNFSKVVVNQLKDSTIKTAVVAGNFPNAQGFLSTKLEEAEIALENGVDEVDIVINIAALLEKQDDQVINEIRLFKNLMTHQKLKVILETGYLKQPELIRRASHLAIDGGADFIKTSTGKVFPGATIEAATIMANVIQEKGKSTGIKISGGVGTYEDALHYLEKIASILGEDYITPNTFRIGASSLMKNLIDG